MTRLLLPLALLLAGCATPATDAPEPRRWLAGDHHVHSEWSVGWRYDPEHPDRPPEPVRGGDGAYPIARNARMARAHGLDWMVSTDHGGPGHDRVNAEMAYPELVKARRAVPDLLLFWGMEFDTPGGEHSTLIIPRHPGERDQLRAIERGYDERNAHPTDPARDTKPKMLEALRFMAAQPLPPVLIANHPSRTAAAAGDWGAHAPDEFRRWAEAAPGVAVGMEGSPGHQAIGVTGYSQAGKDQARGLYEGAPTYGGFDPMTAIVGGAWDALLGQGVRWWITATSDSHRNWRDGGAEFWPGEYSKTYVLARPTYADLLEGIREGRMFAVTGDLITGFEMLVGRVGEPPRRLMPGETLDAAAGEMLTIVLRLTLPRGANGSGRVPDLDHVELIAGGTVPVGAPPDRNPTARVIRRFDADDWRQEGTVVTMVHDIVVPREGIYLRVRGTNTRATDPLPDEPGENPWEDLWFYTNPSWISPRQAASRLPAPIQAGSHGMNISGSPASRSRTRPNRSVD